MRVLRVVTLNIWNRGGPWEERLAAIRAGIAELDADIVGLQEVLRPSEGEGFDQAKLIAEGLGYHIAYGIAETGNIQFGNAALCKYPITRSEVFPLPAFRSTRIAIAPFLRTRHPLRRCSLFRNSPELAL